MKYVLFWCAGGRLIVKVDGQDFMLDAHDILTITSGQVHHIVEAVDAQGYMLTFTYDYFCKDDNDIELVFQNGLFCHFDENEVIHIPEHTAIELHLQHIAKELSEQPYQYLLTIHSRIELILVAINRAKIERGDEIWKPDALFLKFLDLVRADFNHNDSLDHFAGKLGTTEQKLNEQAKLHAGKTAQMVFHGLIASEAKRLLIYENLTIKEIAFQLGFNDPFYFSNFFKKHTGLSPSAFRDALR